jgi:hypothetical protein
MWSGGVAVASNSPVNAPPPSPSASPSGRLPTRRGEGDPSA